MAVVYANEYGSYVMRLVDKTIITKHTFSIRNNSLDLTLPMYNYCGPGTMYFKNIKNNIHPKTKLDEISKEHDKSYIDAISLDDIIRADKKFINDIRQTVFTSKKDKILSRFIIIIFEYKIKHDMKKTLNHHS